jgi:diguanylate cyclase (GGDEF)-like protein
VKFGRGASDARSTWGYPARRPFHLLAGYFVVGCLQLVMTVVRPPLPDTNVRLNVVLAGIGALQVALSLLAGRRLAVWALPYLVASGIVVVAVSAWGAAGGQGQLVAGFYLAILGLFSGYFLTRAEVRILLLTASVAFGCALILNYHLDSLGYILAVIVSVVVMTLVVSSLVQHLRDEAVHDPLTGALNRRGLQDSATVLHDLDARRHLDTTLVEIDLNGFKAYNDTHGHQAGDDLLADVVREWSGVLRRTDLLSRTGGDEFVLVLPATTLDEAAALLERMRASHEVEWSAGLTTWAQGEPLAAALQHADEAMYRNKPGHGTRAAI